MLQVMNIGIRRYSSAASDVYKRQPNDITLELRRKKVRIYDYPDGTIDIKYDGLSLPYSVFDKISQVKQADVVSNKRLVQ